MAEEKNTTFNYLLNAVMLAGHRDARQAAAELAAAALSAPPATTWAPDSPSSMDAGVRADGTVEDCVVETYLRPLEYVTRAPGFLRVVADDGATNVEIRVPDDALASLGLSAPPAQEPVAYIDPIKFAELRRFTDRGGVLTTITPHRAFPDDVPLYASPLPQEPQEVKALTDERIKEIAEAQGSWGACFGYTAESEYEKPAIPAHAYTFARAIERELRGAQEGKAGEAEAEFTIESQDGVCLAAATGPRAEAWAEIQHYAAQYAEEGPLTIYEVTRKPVATLSASSKGEQR